MNKRAFSIVEILVVTGIIGMMIPIIFTVLYAIIRQEARILALTTVKNQGDYILNNLKFNVKNYAVGIHSGTPATDENAVCVTASAVSTVYNPLYLRDRAGNTFFYSVTSGAIASNSSVLATPAPLNTDRVTISGLTMSCNRPTTFSSPILTVSYTVNYVSSSGESPASLTYQTKIKLRNQ